MAEVLDAAQQALANAQRAQTVEAFPSVADYVAASTGNPLVRRRGVDEMTIRRMEKLLSLEHRLKLTGVQPATILNMNPYPLKVNGVLFDDIIVPACPKGARWSAVVIRDYRISWRDEQDDNWTPVEWVPVILAREFEQAYYQNGGVAVLVGDIERDKNFDQHPAFTEKIKETRLRQIAYAWEKKREADAEANTPNRIGLRNINEIHRSLVQLLLREGELADVDRPSWLERTRAEQQLGQACARCKVEPKEGAYMCAACGYILDPVQAFKQGEIEEDHQSLRRLSRKQINELGLAEFIDENLEERNARIAKGQKKAEAEAEKAEKKAAADAEKLAKQAGGKAPEPAK